MANFQKFERTNSRQENRITVTMSNSIGFPTKFYQDQILKDFKYAVLYYDPLEMIVGIQFTNSDEEKHKFSILRSKKGYGGAIVATSFFKFYNIDLIKYHNRYEWKKESAENIGELFTIKLTPRLEIPVVPSNQTV